MLCTLLSQRFEELKGLNSNSTAVKVVATLKKAQQTITLGYVTADTLPHTALLTVCRHRTCFGVVWRLRLQTRSRPTPSPGMLRSRSRTISGTFNNELTTYQVADK
jgi:hypothetical protein